MHICAVVLCGRGLGLRRGCQLYALLSCENNESTEQGQGKKNAESPLFSVLCCAAMGFFDKPPPPDPKELVRAHALMWEKITHCGCAQVKEWKVKLRHETRELDRQITRIEREEQGIKVSIKEAAKKGAMHGVCMSHLSSSHAHRPRGCVQGACQESGAVAQGQDPHPHLQGANQLCGPRDAEPAE